LGYTLGDLAKVLDKLSSYGVRFVIIGDTVVQLSLRKRELSGDVDLYVIEPSVIVEEEKYAEIAEKEGWHFTTTEIGTPKIVARVNDKEIHLEFYENIFDIYIPEEIIEKAGSISVSGIKIRIIKPEEYFVLKARQGVDLDKLEKYVKEYKKKLDEKTLIKTIKLFPLDEQKLIISRLKQVGLEI